jgi:cobalt-precorrin 5A hydrolase
MKIAGIGLRQNASVGSLKSALEMAGGTSLDGLASPIDKCEHPALTELSRELGLPLIPVSLSDLVSQETTTQSTRVLEKRGVGSVAEAAALASAGDNPKLVQSRVVSADRMATCAIAIGSNK